MGGQPSWDRLFNLKKAVLRVACWADVSPLAGNCRQRRRTHPGPGEKSATTAPSRTWKTEQTATCQNYAAVSRYIRQTRLSRHLYAAARNLFGGRNPFHGRYCLHTQMQKNEEFHRNKNVTIILVSHRLESVATLCDRVVWIGIGFSWTPT